MNRAWLVTGSPSGLGRHFCGGRGRIRPKSVRLITAAKRRLIMRWRSLIHFIVHVRREALQCDRGDRQLRPQKRMATRRVRERVVVGYVMRNLQLDDSAAERNGHRTCAIGCVQLFQDVLHVNLHGLFR
jgi:hypothetical protein